MMNNIDLPNGWILTQIGSIVDYGKTLKTELADISPDTWVLELEDIEKDSSKIIQKHNATSRPFKSSKNKFNKGDVLYGKLRPYLNKVVIADDYGVCSTEIVPINAEPNVYNRYLFHWLKNEVFLNYVNEVSYGVNMPRLGTQDGAAAPFLLPSLAEQKVIADTLDALLPQIENIKTHLERIPELLKHFRQSVLYAAVSGELTDEWRKENSEYESIYEVSIDDISLLVTKGASPKWQGISYVDDSSQTLFVTSENIGSRDLLLSDPKYVEDVFNDKQKRSILNDGDVLTNIVGASIGRTAIWRGNRKANINQAVCLIRLDHEKCLPEFMCYYLNSPIGLEKIVRNKVEVARANVSLTNIKELTLNLPSITEQAEIVHCTEKFFAFADIIEQKTNTTLARVHELTQSILSKAFSGELTATWRVKNPELIIGENSAIALLNKIKIERERQKNQLKPNRKAVKKTGRSMSKKIIHIVEALKQSGEPMSGQQLLTASGYPSNSDTELLEKFFLELRTALTYDKSIVKLERSDDGQDWFSLAETITAAKDRL